MSSLIAAPEGGARRWQVALLMAFGAITYLAVTVPGLTRQGLYYDELHQATGAFAYVGEEPEMFAIGSLFGLPVLNTSYSGALKTGVYGLYLRAGGEFTVASWRLLGILFVALGLMVFLGLAFRALGPSACAFFVLLFCTDATVVLATRHDWGPVALALALRLVFLGVWLSESDHATERRRLLNSAILGGLYGLSLFEKLSSVVLVVPLALILWQRCRRDAPGHLRWGLIGVAVGATPLVLANAASWVQAGIAISLEQIGGDGHEVPSLWTLLIGYLDLARGSGAQALILGRESSGGLSHLVVAVVSLGAVFLLSALCRRQREFERGLIAIVSYLGIAIALYLLPNATWVHHWVIGTPFQYLALASTLSGLLRRPWHRLSGCRGAACLLPRVTLAASAVVLVLILARALVFVPVARAMARGESSLLWHPSLTELGHFARAHPEAVFVASDWGVGTQIYCLAQGRTGGVREIFWSYDGPAELQRIVEESGRRTFFLVGPDPPTAVKPGSRQRIERDARSLAGWREVPAEAAVATLAAVRVSKFVRLGVPDEPPAGGP